ncbi:MAG: HAD family hydrolase [Bacteroidales bacterium]
MNKAVFLDRDGVINRKGSSYYIYKTGDFILNEGVIPSLNYFLSNGYILIIITNQGGIARGVYSTEDLERVHVYMADLLEKEGIRFSGIYYCPHHPDISHCECRKPGNLLFENAISDHAIDRQLSVMIGDTDADIIAADKSGIRGIRIPENGNMYELVVKKGLV